MQRANRYLLYGFYFLLIYMPFHVFLSQWLSTFTGGLEIWKVAKDVFLLLAVTITVALVWLKRGFKDKLFWAFTGVSLAYLAVHFLVWLAKPQIDGPPALLAAAYNSRLPAYAILGWSVGLLLPSVKGLSFHKKAVFKVVIAVSSAVALLAVLQFFLPKDLLAHFGYSLERGVKPNFFIDDKPDLPRVFSTLRDPNSLGAYLILPITALSIAWFKKSRARMLIAGLLALHGLALLLSFSRSAWLGAVVSAGLILFWRYKAQAIRFFRKYWPAIAVATLVLVIGVLLAKDQYAVQNIIFHSDENTRQIDSNNKHLIYAKQGVEAIISKPLGHGPGTAGLVSIQTDKTVLTENYFIQIGYEIGLLGLFLLLLIMYVAAKYLFIRGDIYGQIMLAAFIGLTIPNLLLHTWSNEAVAAQWWLLAGLCLAGLKNRKITKKPQTRA